MSIESGYLLRSSEKDREETILNQYSSEQQAEIRNKQQILSSLAYFIGKDFQIPVELNEPGEGWYWNFKDNHIRIDPKDLLDKPMDYLRFVISHEGGHRRVSRTDFIPKELWNQPGFSSMMNHIEDPRTNNFVAEAYPRFRDQMNLSYEIMLQEEEEMEADASKTLGHSSKHAQAGWEYIKQWFRDVQEDTSGLSDDLPPDVREVVENTMASARDSWWRYPSRVEADASEELIRDYAKLSFEINRDEIWPEFKKLVDKDIENQKIQQLAREIIKQNSDENKNPSALPEDLQQKLSEEEQQELSDAIEKAVVSEEENGKEGSEGGTPTPVVDIDSLSDGLKQKIQDYIETLASEVQEALEERARQAIKEFEQRMNEDIAGKLPYDSESKDNDSDLPNEQQQQDIPEPLHKPVTFDPKKLEEFRKKLEEATNQQQNKYEQTRKEVLPVIDTLENDLRELFIARKAQRWQSGFKHGKKIDIKRRIQERAKGISAVESKAWQKRDLPQEKDYAISLLVDLSGSMHSGNKIGETFKAVVVLAEVLNRLSIKTEIFGFNGVQHEFQTFGQPMGREIREHLGKMITEVMSYDAAYNDDGWAITEASNRLSRQDASEKFLIVLSDGLPVPSDEHDTPEFNLNYVIGRIMKETDQKLIGLGVGSGTDHVEKYYPNSVANITTEEMSEKLADVIREAIANHNAF